MIKFDSILKHKKIIFFLFLILLLIESLSFLSYYFPLLNIIIFVFIILITIIISIYKLEWGFYIVLAELFLNSMGYVFYLENEGLKVSLRIGLWLIIISIWLAKFFIDFFKNKRNVIDKYLKIPNFKYVFYLSFFIILGLIFGLIKNGFEDAFFDFNAWLYFVLLLPGWHIISSFNNNNNSHYRFWQNISIIFISAVIFLVFKSLLFLFLFSHNVQIIIADLYYWTRSYGLGEVTNMEGGFYRVFLQSQIFVLLAFIISLSAWSFTSIKKSKINLLIFLSFLASAIILSFSRSFWVGIIIAMCLLFLFLWLKFGFKKMLNSALISIISLSLGFLLVFLVVKFPWPKSTVDFNFESLSERANIKAPESAISSRWALLDVMRDDLRNNILLGRGFGARLEYKSSDPRVLERTADGVYSTYAFEWGWLDIWLKIGLLGLFSYLLLLIKILKDFYKKNKENDNFIYIGLGLGVVVLIVVNFFTPYLNHPLGIGFLILSIYASSHRLSSHGH